LVPPVGATGVVNVFQPGLYHWFRGMRLTDLLASPELVKPKSNLGYVTIRRETMPNVAVDVVSADLREAWLRPNGLRAVSCRPPTGSPERHHPDYL
jgi:hypothetical protein